jgi:type IV pilus assembly protein PilY1
MRLNLNATALTVETDTDDEHDVPWAHYFVRANNDTVYLVELDGVHRYYTFTVTGTGLNEKIDVITEVSPPADIQRDYQTDRQNFANWFTYYRRREFVAKAAIARALRDIEGFRVGVYGINEEISVPLKPVNAMIGGVLEDETDTLIEEMLTYESDRFGGTPLKEGLETVGEYYQNNSRMGGEAGDEPYAEDGGACQQSFTIVVTDGYYGDYSHRPVADLDSSTASPYGEWGGGEAPYTDGYSGTLADIAMYYYANDLSDFDNKLPVNKFDGASHQHMVTLAVAFGITGTLDPDDYEDDPTSPDYLRSLSDGDYVEWPEVTGNRQPASIDDLWHATVNSRGKFLNAGTPGALGEALAALLSNIGARKQGSGASVSVNGDWLYARIGDDLLIFQSSYSNEQDEWTGDVKAFRILAGSGEVDTANPEWSAAVRLELKDWSDRNIYTYNGSDSGLVFDYDELTDSQQAALNSDEDVVDYIKGREISRFRARSQKLADIVHSSPVFENDVVYVGANDGMLHAFNADNGDELFAYVPNLVFENLIDLTDPAYVHQFYVDLTPTVQKGEKLLTETGSGEQTILVGGLGKGGMGYFALDITDPNSLDEDQVLWEFPRQATSPDDVQDMGYSYSKPVVVRSYRPSGSNDYSWIVIAGNGYNSPNGNSVLFILDAASGAVIQKIVAGTGPDNGLSSPIAVDVDFDETVDFVYAGDLLGNLWKFDLTSTNADEWEVAFERDSLKVPLFTALDSNGDTQPITARPDVMLHPEKHGYIVCFGTGKFLGTNDFDDDRLQTIYGIWDYGDRAFVPSVGWSEDDDLEFLGTFRDPAETATLSNQPENVDLLQQIASEVTVGSGEDEVTVRILTAERPQWVTTADSDSNQLPNLHDSAPNDAGWYLDLNVYTGERVISDVILRDGILIVIGFIPEQGRCGSGGDSVFMELNAFTGGQLAGVNFDIHDDGSVGQDDYVEIVNEDGETIYVPPSGLNLTGNIQPPAIVRLNETTERKYLSSSSGGIVEISERAARTGIAYWMEILP